MKSYAVITVLDNLSETSMPWNEFVLYRHKHNPELKQYVIVCDSGAKNIIVPTDLNIYFTEFNVIKIKNAMFKIINECERNNMEYIIHMHQNKSAVFFNFVTVFSGLKKKTLFTVHSQFPAYNFQNKIASFYNALSAQRVINVSKTSYDVYPKIIKKIKGSRMSYISNGVDIERIDGLLENKNRSISDKFRFIYVARMIPLKKHVFLLDVFREIDIPYELIFVGAEDSEGVIRKKIDEYHMNANVIITGLVPRNELFEILKNSDAYVSSSTIEGLPVSVLEAMAVRLPVLLSDISPHREIAKVCEAVQILPFDKSVWKKEIIKLVNSDRNKLKNNGNKCREAIEKNFSLISMHNRYFEEYENMI